MDNLALPSAFCLLVLFLPIHAHRSYLRHPRSWCAFNLIPLLWCRFLLQSKVLLGRVDPSTSNSGWSAVAPHNDATIIGTTATSSQHFSWNNTPLLRDETQRMSKTSQDYTRVWLGGYKIGKLTCWCTPLNFDPAVCMLVTIRVEPNRNVFDAFDTIFFETPYGNLVVDL